MNIQQANGIAAEVDKASRHSVTGKPYQPSYKYGLKIYFANGAESSTAFVTRPEADWAFDNDKKKYPDANLVMFSRRAEGFKALRHT
jgi:hypothetical protein